MPADPGDRPGDGLGRFDAAATGLMHTGVVAGIWLVVRLGVGTYPAANLLVTAGISLALAAIAFPFVWGMLAGSMPRSGGEYIYSSRVIHPAVGIVQGFGHAVLLLFWVFVVAPWVADPGLVLLAESTGATWLYDGASGELLGGLSREWGAFAVAGALNTLALAFTASGGRAFFWTQRVVMTVGLAGAITMAVAFTATSRQTFTANWDRLAAEHSSLDPRSFVDAAGAAAGAAVPTTWSWSDSLAAVGITSILFGSAFFFVFTAGQTRRPGRDLPTASVLSVCVPALLLIWTTAAAYTTVDFDLLSAAAWVDKVDGVAGYDLPLSPDIMTLAWVARPEPVVGALISLSFIAFCFWWLALTYLGFSRLLHAWGMDRMGPRWFAAVSERTATPLPTAVLCFILAQTAITLSVFPGVDGSGPVFAAIGLEAASVWLVTAIAALMFPFVARGRGFWETSPYRQWSLLGVPAVAWGGLLMLAYSGLCFYFLVLAPEVRTTTWPALLAYCGVWLAGLAWYAAFHALRRRERERGTRRSPFTG